VLALLAFASFPVLAQANPNYETEDTNLPGSGGGKSPTPHKNPPGSESSPEGEQSTAPGIGGGVGGGGQSNGGSPKSQEVASKGSNPSSPGGGGESQGKSGSTATKGGKPSNGVQIGGEPASSVSDSGGSSPLVPILIAVAVLAAISVGAVLVRQRRGSAGGYSLKRG
jgi:hypothetical protein